MTGADVVERVSDCPPRENSAAMSPDPPPTEPVATDSEPTPSLPRLFEQLSEVMWADEARLRKRLQRAKREPESRRASEVARVAASIDRSVKRLAARVANAPMVSLPPELPIAERADDIIELLNAHQIMVVAGETGSGKSTQLPKLCLAAGRGRRGLIGHTQPRRLAARSVAERVAEELGSRVGGMVGYKVRFTDEVSEHTYIKLMTDGILLAEITRDPLLLAYDTIIIDEAHERSLTIDFLLGYLHRLLPQRPDLKLVITSATIDTARIAAHFNDAPVLEVSGRTYPVEIRYRPIEAPDDENLDNDEEPDPDNGPRHSQARPKSKAVGLPGKPVPKVEPRDQNDAICDAIRELGEEGNGDILVFFSGEREIRDAAEAIAAEEFRDTEIVPLFARLSSAEQHRIFAPHTGRRIVLATNVAETSLTVPGIRYVIDPGMARISRYSKRTKVQRLPIERISQASANQRSGRCGRVAPGICIRLYDEADFTSRPLFTEPEIQRTNLASVILQMAAMGLGDIESFPFIDPPDARQIRDGIALLEELGAVKQGALGTPDWLTPIGRQISGLPLDPRLGRMLIAANELGALKEMTIITAALAIVDPRERPSEKRDAASAAHARFADPSSDFLSWLKLWNFVVEERAARSTSKFRKLCKEHFLNALRLREWQDINTQLQSAAKELKWTPNTKDATPDQIHQSVLPGLLSHVGSRDPNRPEYRGARSTRFAVAPGSALFRSSVPWLVAAELTETNRLWGRCVAPVQTKWIERAGEHLVTKSHTAPTWDAQRGSATINERVTLYGLILVGARPVPLGRIDPAAAREMFIRHALIDGEWHQRHRFVAKNRQVLEEMRAFGSRVRRSIELDDMALWAFYDARLPTDITTVAHFDKWWKRRGAEQPTLFDVSIDDLLTPPGPSDDPDTSDDAAAMFAKRTEFPDTWQQGNLALPLEYVFAPQDLNDGVTIDIPVTALSGVRPDELSWNVPGVRRELVDALIRSLPKQLRRQFVPAAEAAEAVFTALMLDSGSGRGIGQESAHTAVARELTRIGDTPIRPEDFRLDLIAPHLRLTYRLIGTDGSVIAQDKDFVALRRQHTSAQKEAFATAPLAFTLPKGQFTTWDNDGIGTLRHTTTITSPSGTVVAYPTLVDGTDHVRVQAVTTQDEQDQSHWSGTLRLVMFALGAGSKQVDRLLTNRQRLTLATSFWGSVNAFADDCVRSGAQEGMRRFFSAHTADSVWSADEFSRLHRSAKATFPDVLDEVVRRGVIMAQSYAAIDVEIERIRALTDVVADVRNHRDRLVYRGCLAAVSAEHHGDLVRYLVGIERRLERVGEKTGQDRSAMLQCRTVEAEFDRAVARFGMNHNLEAAGWMIEEFRLSLFAQTVGVKGKVSEKRIRTLIAAGSTN